MAEYDILVECQVIIEANNEEEAENIAIKNIQNCLNPYYIEAYAEGQTVKRGRWIEQRHIPTNGYNYNVPYSTYVCSNCGLEIHNDEYSKYVRGTYTNCPVCTARMDLGDEKT